MKSEEIITTLRTRDNPPYEVTPDYLNDWNVLARVWKQLNSDEQDAVWRMHPYESILDSQADEAAKMMAKAIYEETKN